MGFIDQIIERVAEVANFRLREAYDTAEYHRKQADTWRGIAAEMGYEPKAHLNVRPTAPWLLERIAKYRQQVADELSPNPPVNP